jgi:SAM-dependent methyltransferase
MNEYDKQFQTRADQYMYAMTKYPEAMREEFEAAREVLEVGDRHHILHIQAGGVPLFDPNVADSMYRPFETSPDFAKFGFELCTYDNIPLSGNTMDRAIILASLHHATDEERAQLFREVHRVCRPGARFVIGDVRSGSRMDRWLNEFVNAHNPNGHSGRFLSVNDTTLTGMLECNGWRLLYTDERRYRWRFQTEAEMYDFVRNLFGLKVMSDTFLRDNLQQYLDSDATGFAWELLFYVCERKE